MRGGGGSRRNGITAERGQLTGESAGRGVSATAQASPRRPCEVSKTHGNWLGEGKIREMPGMAGIERGFGALDSGLRWAACDTLLECCPTRLTGAMRSRRVRIFATTRLKLCLATAATELCTAPGISKQGTWLP